MSDLLRDWLQQFASYREYVTYQADVRAAHEGQNIRLLTEDEFNEARWDMSNAAFRVDRDEWARHQFSNAETDQKVVRLQVRQDAVIAEVHGMAGDLKRISDAVLVMQAQLTEMKSSLDELKDIAVDCMSEEEVADKIEGRLAREQTVRKPRRLEVLTIVIAGVVALQALGLFDAIRIALAQWFTGSP